MRKFVSIILPVLAACIITSMNAQEKKIFSPEAMLQLKRVSDMRLSPDGSRILLNVGEPNLQENKVFKDLWMISSNGLVLKRITNDRFSENGAVWSPDGSKIAYLTNQMKAPQIAMRDMMTGAVSIVTDEADGVDNLSWSPDGKYFSYTAKVKTGKNTNDIHPSYPKANVRIYSKLPIRSWDEWIDEYVSHLFIIPIDGGSNLKGKDLLKGTKYETPVRPQGGAEQIAWSPDGKSIAFTAKNSDNPAFSTNTDIFVMDIATGAIKNITESLPSYDKDPSFSPDGRYVAFHSQERPGFESDRIRLMLFDRKTGKIRELSKSLDQWVGDFVWSADSKTIYFSAEDGPTVQLYQINAESGDWKVLTHGNHNFDGGLAVSPDKSTLYALKRDMQHSFELYSIDIESGKDKQLTHFNDNMYAGLMPINIESREITAVDGKKFQTWVLYPPDFDPSKKYPLIAYCQGGPQSTISQYFSLRWNLYAIASHGYIVVAPNRRGVPGFGQAWNDAISGDWGGLPMSDILSATDAVSKEPYVDKTSMAAVGASAGGYAAYWLEGHHENRFAAFVAHCGVFNMESMYGATEEIFFPNWEFGGPYWDSTARAFYEKNSPHRYVAAWNRPIMIVTGEKDFRVPFTQSLEAFTAAQSKGLPSKILVFPDENHWILKLQEQALWYDEFFGFLDTYCKRKP